MRHAIAEVEFDNAEAFRHSLITALAQTGLRIQTDIGQQIVLGPPALGALSHGPLKILFFPVGLTQVVVTTTGMRASIVGPRHHVKRVVASLSKV
jgi:hypothetical protein